MSSSRFFVANLPSNVKEKDLSSIFEDYGVVQRVELKTKEDPLAPDVVKVIAFITLQINPNDVTHCIKELNWQTVKGAQIKVSLAKESFLDRLKREREEAEAVNDVGKGMVHNDAAHAAPLLSRNMENTRKTFTEEELARLDEDDSIAPELLITKKRAANSVHNGRIVIQNYDTAPLHIIASQKKKKKSQSLLPDKANTAEQKRKESVNKMNNQYKQNKSVIQQALAGLDNNRTKKIKFSDGEDDDGEVQPSSKKVKAALFDEDDLQNDVANDFQLKPEMFSKKGEELLQLQSKQSLDPRFRIDAKFIDDGEADEVEDNDPKETPDNERNWQMDILEQVVGTKLSTADDLKKAAQKKRMLRYDPAKQDHQKLLRTETKQDAIDQTKTKPKKYNKESVEKEAALANGNDTDPPPVSKEVFYVVTDTLAQSLKSRGDGFSLLNMFGSEKINEHLEQRNDELKKVTDAKILLNKYDDSTLNPFTYDSSTDDELENVESAETVTKNDSKAAQHSKKKPANFFTESFFIPHNDARLKEGAKFFKSDKKDVAEEDYEKVRNRLKVLIKTKINKTKKNIMSKNSGGNINRVFRHKGKIKRRN